MEMRKHQPKHVNFITELNNQRFTTWVSPEGSAYNAKVAIIRQTQQEQFSIYQAVHDISR